MRLRLAQCRQLLQGSPSQVRRVTLDRVLTYITVDPVPIAQMSFHVGHGNRHSSIRSWRLLLNVGWLAALSALWGHLVGNLWGP